MAFTEARLSKPPSELLKLYDVIPGLEREKRQFDAFIQIDLAHLVMLVEQKILTKETASHIFPVLLELRNSGVDTLPIDPERGTLLLQVEGFIAERIGENIAGSLHTGRSRIDQGATARRLFKRQELLRVMKGVISLQRVLIEQAERYSDTIMPTYTHMQHAQPGTLGHYLLGFVDKLHDDYQRCVEVFARVNRNPLGAVGLSGTSWPLDRARTTELLGFDSFIANAKIARESFYACEIASALAFVMATINDIACDLHVWSSIEFGLVAIDDSFCTTSSIFPQKKNAIALETVKQQAGMAINWGGTALATHRGEGTGDQGGRTVPMLDGAFNSTANMLALTTGIVETMQVNSDRMASALATSWSTASNLADVLVQKCSISFREAHHVVARLVRISEEGGIARPDVTSQHLSTAAQQTIGHPVSISQEELMLALDPMEFIRTRRTAGCVSPGEVQKLLAADKESLQQDEAWLKKKDQQIKRANELLKEAVKEMLA